MSRREEEFKHRTSIFEGAYRAWSHLGGLDADELECKSAKDLDPVTYPLVNDTRSNGSKKTKNVNDDGSARLDCPYEPLPRAGLSHPFVQAILAPWLGPNADNEAVELGLATLRTWWQHRRKGENKSSVKALGTAKMRVVVDKYTRHFFDLAHCLVVSDDAQPPRTLHMKLKQVGKERRESQGLLGEDDDELSMRFLKESSTSADNTKGPLEKIHAAQMHHFQGLSLSSSNTSELNVGPLVNVKGKCIPGKIDLPGMVEAVNRHSNQLAHRGGLLSHKDNAVTSSSSLVNDQVYGDTTTTPVVFQTRHYQHFFIVMNVNGITCPHCVKIVETVLKGCNGGKSPIIGLLDAAADKNLSCVVIHIDNPKSAKRIAFESARNLALVGYTAVTKEISTKAIISDQSPAAKLESLQKAVMNLAKAYPFELWEFTYPCCCPDSGVFPETCSLHSQMNDRMFKAFANHERQLSEYVQCRNSSSKAKGAGDQQVQQHQPPVYQGIMPRATKNNGNELYPTKPLVIDQPMEFPPIDMSLELISKASDVEPIPLDELHLSASSSSSALFSPGFSIDANHSPNNSSIGEKAEYHHATYGILNGSAPLAQYTYNTTSNAGSSSNNNNRMDPRYSISALSIDWETLGPLDLLDHTEEKVDENMHDHHHTQQQHRLQHHDQSHDIEGEFHQLSPSAENPVQQGLAYQV